jgi:hypothetical protein
MPSMADATPDERPRVRIWYIRPAAVGLAGTRAGESAASGRRCRLLNDGGSGARAPQTAWASYACMPVRIAARWVSENS